jgi:hypothetical protein
MYLVKLSMKEKKQSRNERRAAINFEDFRIWHCHKQPVIKSQRNQSSSMSSASSATALATPRPLRLELRPPSLAMEAGFVTLVLEPDLPFDL